jgi:DNA-binding transcriptional ArsR family regulator
MEQKPVEPLLRTLKAAADASRLRILRILGVGPFHVAELQEILGLGQSTVSRHLKVWRMPGGRTPRRHLGLVYPAGRRRPGPFLGLLFADGDANGMRRRARR